MKLIDVKNWKALHLEGRVILKSDKSLYSKDIWQEIVTSVEVQAMDRAGHFKAV